MLSDCIKVIYYELNKYKDLTRQELLTKCVNHKLAVTLEKYNEEIEETAEFLLQKSSARVLKALLKIQKKDDKNAIEQEIKNKEEEIKHECN